MLEAERLFYNKSYIYFHFFFFQYFDFKLNLKYSVKLSIHFYQIDMLNVTKYSVIKNIKRKFEVDASCKNGLSNCNLFSVNYST